MSLLILAAAVALQGPAVAQSPRTEPSATERCPQATRYYAYRDGKKLRPKALTELPDANAYSAVYRLVDGCQVPVVVKYGVSPR